MFDLELPCTKKRLFVPDDGSKFEALMRDGVINRAGSLCKIGINVITRGVILEAN